MLMIMNPQFPQNQNQTPSNDFQAWQDQYFGNDTPVSSSPPPRRSNKIGKILVGLLVLVILAGGGFLGYCWWLDQSNQPAEAPVAEPVEQPSKPNPPKKEEQPDSDFSSQLTKTFCMPVSGLCFKLPEGWLPDYKLTGEVLEDVVVYNPNDVAIMAIRTAPPVPYGDTNYQNTFSLEMMSADKLDLPVIQPIHYREQVDTTIWVRRFVVSALRGVPYGLRPGRHYACLGVQAVIGDRFTQPGKSEGSVRDGLFIPTQFYVKNKAQNFAISARAIENDEETKVEQHFDRHCHEFLSNRAAVDFLNSDSVKAAYSILKTIHIREEA